jgi:hypothetical protein
VEYDGRPVAKFGGAKSTLPGRKQIFRPNRNPAHDVLSVRDADEAGRALLEPVWRDGQTLHGFEPGEARRCAAIEIAGLQEAVGLPPFLGEAPLPTLGADLAWLAEQVRYDAFAWPSVRIDPTSRSTKTKA